MLEWIPSYLNEKLLGAPPRVKLPKDVRLCEIRVNVLKYQTSEGLLEGVKDVLFLTIPVQYKVTALKEKIHGLTCVPYERIRLMFCGTVLSDADVVPEDAYELTTRVPDDEDVFRPHIFLTLSPVEEEEKPPSEASEPSEIDEEELAAELAMKAKLEAKRLKEEEVLAARMARVKELQEGVMAEHEKDSEFVLDIDLEKIECSHFLDQLSEAGFEDEGAFACITDEVLREKGLWIPRKARVRIVALADSIKRRLEVAARGSSSATADVNKMLKQKGEIHGRTIEGVEGNFTNKADVAKAFANKVKEEKLAAKEAAMRELERQEAERAKKEPKPHDAATKALIRHLRWINARDEFDCPINYYRPLPLVFCCKKHELEALERRKIFLKQRSETFFNDLTVRIANADKTKTNFVSRVALRVTGVEQLAKEGYSLPAEEIERLLDLCIMPSAEQNKLAAWGSTRERMAAPNGTIPIPWYDAKRYIASLLERFEDKDEQRFI